MSDDAIFGDVSGSRRRFGWSKKASPRRDSNRGPLRWWIGPIAGPSNASLRMRNSAKPPRLVILELAVARKRVTVVEYFRAVASRTDATRPS